MKCSFQEFIITATKYVSAFLFIGVFMLKGSFTPLTFQICMFALFMIFGIFTASTILRAKSILKDGIPDDLDIGIDTDYEDEDDMDLQDLYETNIELAKEIISKYKTLFQIYSVKTELNIFTALTICSMTFACEVQGCFLVFEMILASYTAITGIIASLKMIKAKIGMNSTEKYLDDLTMNKQ
ncbi:MAG: hypothetical protein ACI4NE_07515 [Succinivibrio sp.]